MSESAFGLLATPIQRILWRMQWASLRPIQERAIEAFHEHENDLIISARTASGKTEAAFLPVLSQVFSDRQPSVQALYVGPLKALINDQFGRLEELCQYAEIPVHRWHGDVSDAQRRALVERPGGVLLITPESIESLFINRSSALDRIFAFLRFVVIDELHAFVGRERGTHLRSLLYRLAARSKTPQRMLALSATLGDYVPLYQRWMRPAAPDSVGLIDDKSEDRSIHFKIYGYRVTPKKRQDEEGNAEAVDEPLDEGTTAMISDIVQAHAGSTNLIFANQKAEIEWLCDLLNERCRRDGRPEEFLVHHGSLSREVREYTESMLRSGRPFTTLCSSTLELGIDIGSIQAVGQIGPPWSVNSMVQRLGRGGRRGDTATMRLFLRQEEPGPKSTLVDWLYPDLLQAIALTELMLDRWIEPPAIDELDLSTFVHQVMSVLAETGGIAAPKLFDRLVDHGVFSGIDRRRFVSVLQCLADHDLVEQTAENDLILGLAGQDLVGRFDFYAAFMTADEYRVTHQGQLIGMLSATYIPPVGEHLLLAARRWEVKEIDDRRQEVVVAPAKGRKPPRFEGHGGEIHPRVRQKMRDVLLGVAPIAYLSAQAQTWLQDARKTALDSQLSGSALLATGPNECLWFTWTGTKAQRTLAMMAATQGLKAGDFHIALQFAASAKDVRAAFERVLTNLPTPQTLASQIAIKQVRKFDRFLSDDLLVEGLAESVLDVDQARSIAAGIQ